MRSWWNLFFCVAAVFVYAAKAQDWNYDDPASWVNDFPQCGGQNQSPIDLRLGADNAVVKKVSDLEDEGISYKLLNYDKDVSGIFRNTGHALEMNITETTDEETPAFELTEDGTTTVYYLKAVDIHFQSTHTISGGRYYLEMHLEHRDSNDNVLVLAYLPLRCRQPSAISDILLEQFDNLLEPESQVDIASFPAKNLLGTSTQEDELCDVIKYSGSMIRPPCTEGVTWFVMYKDSICFTMDQINKLKEAKSEDNGSLEGFRPNQPENGRTFDVINC